MGPGAFAEHFVAFQAGLVGLAESVARSPHTDVLHQAQVARLMADQRLCEDVGCLLVIGLDAPGKKVERLFTNVRLMYGADMTILLERVITDILSV